MILITFIRRSSELGRKIRKFVRGLKRGVHELFIDVSASSCEIASDCLARETRRETTGKYSKVRRMDGSLRREAVGASFASNNYATDVESLASHYTSVVARFKTRCSVYPVGSTCRQWNQVVCNPRKSIVVFVVGSNTPKDNRIKDDLSTTHFLSISI